MKYRIIETTVYEVEAVNAVEAGIVNAGPYLAITREVKPLPPTVEERYMAAIPQLVELVKGFQQ